jgi:hypothetical protein
MRHRRCRPPGRGGREPSLHQIGDRAGMRPRVVDLRSQILQRTHRGATRARCGWHSAAGHSPHRRRHTCAAPTCPGRADGPILSPSSRSSPRPMGEPWATHGHDHPGHPSTRRRGTGTETRDSATRAGSVMERMTRFELATSTLARWRSSQLSYIRVPGRKVTGPVRAGKPCGGAARGRTDPRKQPLPRPPTGSSIGRCPPRRPEPPGTA